MSITESTNHLKEGTYTHRTLDSGFSRPLTPLEKVVAIFLSLIVCAATTVAVLTFTATLILPPVTGIVAIAVGGVALLIFLGGTAMHCRKPKQQKENVKNTVGHDQQAVNVQSTELGVSPENEEVPAEEQSTQEDVETASCDSQDEDAQSTNALENDQVAEKDIPAIQCIELILYALEAESKDKQVKLALEIDKIRKGTPWFKIEISLKSDQQCTALQKYIETMWLPLKTNGKLLI